MTDQRIPEFFLHWLWRYRLYDPSALITNQGESVVVVDPGDHNHGAGPDFLDAKVEIGGIQWVGPVEIHVQSKEWFEHGHDKDRAYNNVVLHVVCEQQPEVIAEMPTLNLFGKIPTHLIDKWRRLQNSDDSIPCGSGFLEVDDLTKDVWLERMMVQRLERRTMHIRKVHQDLFGDWAEIFHRILLKYMGFKTNEIPMEMLSRKVPYGIIRRERTSLEQLLALLRGVANLGGHEGIDHGAVNLRFEALKRKYDLRSIPMGAWKKGRLRPANFPGVRIDQLASFYHRIGEPAIAVLESKEIGELRQLLQPKQSDARVPRMGSQSVERIITNVFLPFIFAYEKAHGSEGVRVLDYYRMIRPEMNSKVKKWSSLGFEAKSNFESQALMELLDSHCSQKRCLDCAIGLANLAGSDRKNQGVF